MLFAAYATRFACTIQHAIEDSWRLLDRLRSRGHAIHAITNWSAETWPIGLTAHPRLQEAFGVTIVSGQEKMTKPDPAIFHLLCQRAGVTPSDCTFIDDSAANVAGAEAVGMDAIRFTDPAALDRALTDRGLL
nr:HAD-IA family hydrolase [Mesobacterium pallidum]